MRDCNCPDYVRPRNYQAAHVQNRTAAPHYIIGPTERNTAWLIDNLSIAAPVQLAVGQVRIALLEHFNIYSKPNGQLAGVFLADLKSITNGATLPVIGGGLYYPYFLNDPTTVVTSNIPEIELIYPEALSIQLAQGDVGTFFDIYWSQRERNFQP